VNDSKALRRRGVPTLRFDARNNYSVYALLQVISIEIWEISCKECNEASATKHLSSEWGDGRIAEELATFREMRDGRRSS